MNYFKNIETILIINVIVSKKLIKLSFFVENVPIEVIYISGIINMGSIKLKPKNKVRDKIIADTLEIFMVNICFLDNNVLCLLKLKTILNPIIEMSINMKIFTYSIS